jgi:hypothetical protein
MFSVRKTWYRFSEKALRTHLTDNLGWPSDMVDSMAQQIHDDKQARRKVKIKEGHVYNAWQLLLASARAEAANVRVLKSQTKMLGIEQPARWATLCAYEACISSTIEKLRKVQDAGEHTPAQFVEFLQREVGRTIPNDGTFWVDYVKPADKRKITAMFNALPQPARGKKKTPFERRIPMALHMLKRKTLNDQIDSAEQATQTALSMNPDSFTTDELHADLKKIYRARYVLDTLPKNAPLPARWQALK